MRERVEALVLEENINGKEEKENRETKNVKVGERKEKVVLFLIIF
jgi:hypothetical protein